MTENNYDIIVFGATSFVGKILTHYLMDTYGVAGGVRWAMAGRSRTKLEAQRARLGDDAKALEMIVVDAADESGLRAMAARASVVISTVGPYALYGEPLVKVCAESGTDYVDLTGEAQWIARMLAKYEAQAKASGARIVHCCGFDSMPFDLGVHFLQSRAQSAFGAPATRIKMGVKAIRGGMSGGTAASLINVMKEASNDPALRREMRDPYSICPAGHGFTARQRNISGPVYDEDFDRVLAPFIMAAINTRVVHRSNALTGKAYGENFRYDEAVFTKGRVGATMMSLGLGLFMVLAVLGPTRALLERFVLPKPGEGPSPEAQKNGFYDLRFFGRTEAGEEIRTRVTGDRDPGYGSTGKMLAEAGICLAQDVPKSGLGGGFWTPATALGDALIKRLEEKAGLTFEVEG